MKKIIEFITYSNLWIAAGITSFIFYFYHLKSIELNYNLVAFVFSSTLFTYNFQRQVKKYLNPDLITERIKWMERNKILVLSINLISFSVAIYTAIYLNKTLFIILIPSAIISFFYAGNILMKKQKAWREIPHAKAFLISFTIASVCSLLPSLNEQQIDINTFVCFIAFSMNVFALAILFDLRDIQLDDKKLNTIPQVFGFKKTLLISIAIILLSTALINVFYFPELISILFALVAIIVILMINENKPEFYYSFIIDGLLIIPGILSLLFDFFLFHP